MSGHSVVADGGANTHTHMQHGDGEKFLLSVVNLNEVQSREGHL